jgi:hypothetical protein
MRGRGTDRLVVAVMPGNSGGAKGAGCPDKRLTGPANEERYARPRSRQPNLPVEVSGRS